MNNDKSFDTFTNKYSLSKTLRFELKPVGETPDYIAEFKSQSLQQVVLQDQQRIRDYQDLKRVLNDYHRSFIEKSLSHFGEQVSVDDLQEALTLKAKKDAAQKDAAQKDAAQKAQKEWEDAQEEWEKNQKDLREKIRKCFTVQPEFETLFKKKLVENHVPNWLANNPYSAIRNDRDALKAKLKQYNAYKDENLDDCSAEELSEKLRTLQSETVKKFDEFFTYLGGFNQNRKNMYVDKAQSTAIAFRVVDDNLSIFFANFRNYQKLKELSDPSLNEVREDLSLSPAQLDEYFTPQKFIDCITQTGIDEYNRILGGYTEEGNVKKKGVNEAINLYHQQHLDESGKKKVGRLIRLKKQILSEREGLSFRYEVIETDGELIAAVKELDQEAELPIRKLQELLATVEDEEDIFVLASELHKLSKAMLDDHEILKSNIIDYAEKNPFTKTKRANFIKKKVYDLKFLASIGEGKSPSTYFQQEAVYERWAETRAKAAEIWELEALDSDRTPPPRKEESGGKGFEQVEKIRNLLEACMGIIHLAQPLYLKEKKKVIEIAEQNMRFYGEFTPLYEELTDLIIPLYNKVRNYLTKKTFSRDKVKINFEKSTLLNGWDRNKEKDNLTVLFRNSSGQYYLGILSDNHRDLFDYTEIPKDADTKRAQKRRLEEEILATEGEEYYEKMHYKFLPNPPRMLPKVFFADENKNIYTPSPEILAIRRHSSHTKDGTLRGENKKKDFNKADLHTWIDFCKESIKKNTDWAESFHFDFSPTESFEDVSVFYKEVQDQGYKVSFHHIKKSYVEEAVCRGKLYLFQIYTKDFSPHSSGRPNLHTLYWKGLFEEENLKNVVLKLNGKAEIFYREHSIKDPYTHKAHQGIRRKSSEDDREKSVFPYDIVKDRRFSRDKFFFHVPITLNFKSPSAPKLNNEVHKLLRNNEDIKIIGIDRGERHLLYYTIIDQQGRICDQGSFNTIDNGNHSVDYHHKLDEREKDRDQARKSWAALEGIKELKAGYLSHVVHKLAELIIRHQAVVCLENLTAGFKRGRMKIEKQVYQKFEKALIDKLNYLVFKDKEAGEAGHYLKAYQLTDAFKSFKDLSFQSGILFYVLPHYTSKADPVTGFINLLSLRYKNIKEAQDFFSQIADIRFNEENDYFEFVIDYRKMTHLKSGLKKNSKKSCWTVCTHGKERYRYNKQKKEMELVNVTAELKQLFEKQGIDYATTVDLKDSIIQQNQDSAPFFGKLIFLLNLTLQMRYTNREEGRDFILSPVADEEGNFFHSEQVGEDMPQNADANGAYHIALKGLWILQQINQWSGEKGSLHLGLKNEVWFNFIQERMFKKEKSLQH